MIYIWETSSSVSFLLGKFLLVIQCLVSIVFKRRGLKFNKGRFYNHRHQICFTILVWNYHQSSSRLTRWKHNTVQTNMKKETNSMNMAPVSIIWACLRIIGIAKLPTVEAPVKNLAAPIHLEVAGTSTCAEKKCKKLGYESKDWYSIFPHICKHNDTNF